LTGWLASLQGTLDPQLQALVLLLLLLLLHLLNLLLLLNHLQPPLRQPINTPSHACCIPTTSML
jgi:hypothetical protein